MKRIFLFFVCFSWMGMAHATTPGPSLGILIDTAYVTNDLHVVLEH